ncbi:hypothetical protein [Kosmotoga pacifica]|uniref:Uncharacterized protein n=1 Tax=Kosmotoga pacifica TaxID=1330330 RepID=A0A0G2Z541_9BACT|nr:hypothetical protein [Kosmotoga pacifica]AKI96730.1 hypothetical protein IX53_01605 [Kosmotoga pacifica]
MRKLVIIVFLVFSLTIFGYIRFNLVGFYSPYEINYSGWNSIVSFNDDQYRSYDFAVNEPSLHLSATHSLAFGVAANAGRLNISYWLDLAMSLGGGRNEFRIGTVRRNFESGYTFRILSYHYHDTLADPLSTVSYYVTFDDKMFDPTETEIAFLHRIYNFRSGFYSTFYFRNFWLSVAYYPGLFNFTVEAAGVKISDNNHTVFIPFNPNSNYDLSGDEFCLSLGFDFRIF